MARNGWPQRATPTVVCERSLLFEVLRLVAVEAAEPDRTCGRRAVRTGPPRCPRRSESGCVAVPDFCRPERGIRRATRAVTSPPDQTHRYTAPLPRPQLPCSLVSRA